MARRRTWWTREFKLSAIARIETAETMAELAAELGVDRGMLTKWRRAYEAGGAEALTFPGQRPGVAAPACPPVAPKDMARDMPGKEMPGREMPGRDMPGREMPDAPPSAASSDGLAAARRRIAELERKIGQQQLDLDFFRAALRHVREQRRRTGGSGGAASTP